jgi:hypothetical protein
MSNFTQLNLQGNTGGKPMPNPQKPAPGIGDKPASGNKTNDKQTPKKHTNLKAASIVGAFMAATLITTFTLGTNGCSKSKSAAVSTQTPAVTMPTAPAAPAITPSPAPVAKVAKKSPRQHKLATFKSKDYNLSFRYPVHYAMKEGEEIDSTQANLESTTMNFVQSGGATLSTVELPQGLYAGTDFTSAFFTVNVNSKLTADQCNQFAFPEKSELDTNSDGPSVVNVEGTNYTEMEDVVSDGALQANARYYHLYQNNVCYEFALGLQTAGDQANKDLKPVNRDKVFDKLQWMLATVKVKPVSVATEAAKSTPPAEAPAPATTAATASAPAVEPAATPNNQ